MFLLISIILMDATAQYLIKGRKRRGIEIEVVNGGDNQTSLAELSPIFKYWKFFF